MTTRKDKLPDAYGLSFLSTFLGDIADKDPNRERAKLFDRASNQAFKAMVAVSRKDKRRARMQLAWCRRNAKTAISWAGDDLGIEVPEVLRP